MQDLQSDQGFLLCPRKAFLQLGGGAKASPVIEDEEGWQKAWGVLRYEETVTGFREPLRL